MQALRAKFYKALSSVGACLPQITVPAGTVDGAPVGLSFVSAAGSDAYLLACLAAVVTA